MHRFITPFFRRMEVELLRYFDILATAESNNKTAANDESRLFEDLFVYNKYGNSVRPVKNKTRPVQVFLDVALVQLIDLVSFKTILSQLSPFSEYQNIKASSESALFAESHVSISAINNSLELISDIFLTFVSLSLSQLLDVLSV